MIKTLKRLFNKSQKRKFAAAKINRLTSEWITSPIQINQELKTDLKLLKIRCRETAKNDPHMKKYLRMRQVNIVGDNGIYLIASAKDVAINQLDTKANALIESKYADFSTKNYFTVDGRMSRRDVEKLLVSSLVYDGEFFCRIVRGFDNKYNISLQILDSYNCDILYNTQLQNDNYVINGIEVDSYGRPVNYYFLTGRSDSYNTYDKRVVIPAEDIIHVFYTEFTAQTRGIPVSYERNFKA